MTTSPRPLPDKDWNNTDIYPLIMLAYASRCMDEALQQEPDFGHYPADIDFGLDADLDPQFPLRPVNTSKGSNASNQLDDYYYRAAGVEPPTRGYQGGRWSFKAVLCWCLFWVVVAEVVLLVAGY